MYSHKILISILMFGSFAISSYCIEPAISVEIHPVSCNSHKDGSLSISVENTSGSHILRIIQQNDTTYRNIDSNSEIEIINLNGGVINIDLIANSKVVASTNALIIEPDPLSGGKIKVEKMPSDGSVCDGIISVEPNGGNPPYTYKWSENAGSGNETIASGICRGIYRCEINDSKNCGPVYVSVPLIENALKKNSD